MSDTQLIDPRLFRSTMGRFATGVTIVSASHQEGHPHAATVNAFLSVSLDPPLVLVSLGRQARMNTLLHLGKRYGINVLSTSQEQYSRHFGGRPIAGLQVNWLPAEESDVPLLDDSLAHIVASVVDIHPAGDHLLYISQVESLRYWERHPLLFFSGKYKQIEAHEPMNAWSISSESW